MQGPAGTESWAMGAEPNFLRARVPLQGRGHAMITYARCAGEGAPLRVGGSRYFNFVRAACEVGPT